MNKKSFMHGTLLVGAICCVIGAAMLIFPGANKGELRPTEVKKKPPQIVEEQSFEKIQKPEDDHTKKKDLSNIFSFSLDGGDSISLPIPFSDLADTGWVLSDDGTLEPGAYTWQNVLTKDNKELIVQLENNSEEQQLYSKCDIAKVQVSGDLAADLKFNGLGLKNSFNEFVEKFGEPDHVIEEQDKKKIQYMNSPNQKFEAVFDKNGEACEKISFQWLTED